MENAAQGKTFKRKFTKDVGEKTAPAVARLVRDPKTGRLVMPRPIAAKATPVPVVVDPEIVHKALFDVMAGLVEILETERRYLAERNMDGIKAILPRKYQLISIYQANVKTIMQQAAIVKNASDDVRKKLKESGDQLDLSTRRNALAFKGAIDGTRRRINNVMGLIKEGAMKENATYRNFKPGAVGKYAQTYEPVAVSKTV